MRLIFTAVCGMFVFFDCAIPLFAQTPAVADRTSITFEKNIAPLFKAHCQKCHGGKKREGGLDLRRKFTLVKGGDSGSAIDIKHPEKSLVLELLEEGLMPPEGERPLSKTQIELLRTWIKSGARISGQTEAPLPEARATTNEYPTAVRKHWAFQPVGHVGLPKTRESGWLRTPVDAFILSALEQRGWQPAPVASRRDWIRRVTFDLTGLPPRPQEIRSFENDKRIDAYERVVDRLLSSPQYGERWAQHWLDVVRFAETEGFEYDRQLPDAWRFRDYVIDSFNNDKPFDRFITEQIAGDEIDPQDPECFTASIFHRLGPVRRNAGNPEIALSRNEVLTERTNIIGEAFLGLTVGCARCHNHKLEPITQKDYYRLQAYFAATAEFNKPLVPTSDQDAWDAKTKAIQSQIAKLKKQLANATGRKKDELSRQVKDLESQLPPHPPTIPGTRNDSKNRTAIHVLRRGDWEKKGVPVGPRPLSLFVSASFNELKPDVENPRTQLASWMADGKNPLTARVIVNRVWQHHFGTGLVRTPNDFGTHGDPPSHPALLDWLAKTLVEQDWRLKPIHRLIVLSSTYRQSSRSPMSAKVLNADPENRMLWRFPRRRLSGEEIRDSVLSVSGRLNKKFAGESVLVPVPEEMIALLYKPSQWQVTEDKSEHNRRSIYLIAKRNLRLPFLEAFDAPALQTSCPHRETSTHAPQALAMLNGQFVNEMAAAFAARLMRECGRSSKPQVERAFWLALGRPPTPRERELSLGFLRDQSLQEFALAMFNLSGFVYVQ